MGEQVRLACVASGSGTDFESIAKAWKNGWLPEISEVVLISTKEGAGCIDKAKALGIRCAVVKSANKEIRLDSLQEILSDFGQIELMFLVGCILKVYDRIVYPQDSTRMISVYNIHPADPHKHGGQGMYGLKVHLHVLTEIFDLVERGMAKMDDRFFTTPVVHEVVAEYDKGHELLRAQVEIPAKLISAWLKGEYAGMEETAAKNLQQIVLPYEWQMLPYAVRLAARKILDQQKEGG